MWIVGFIKHVYVFEEPATNDHLDEFLQLLHFCLTATRRGLCWLEGSEEGWVDESGATCCGTRRNPQSRKVKAPFGWNRMPIDALRLGR